MSNAFVTIKMCYVYNQWYDISCAILYIYIYIYIHTYIHTHTHTFLADGKLYLILWYGMWRHIFVAVYLMTLSISHTQWSWLMNMKECGRKWSWPKSTFYQTRHSQDAQCPRLDLNHILFEYKSKSLIYEPTCSAWRGVFWYQRLWGASAVFAFRMKS